MMLWTSGTLSPVCRIGVAGDFLPANGLIPPAGQSWSGMAEPVARYFQDLDFSVVNLECPLNVIDARRRIKASLGGSFCASNEVLDYLQALKIGLVGIANNHIYDYGQEGIASTRKAVQQRSMVPIGAGGLLDEVPDVYLWQSFQRFRVGFWAAAHGLQECATSSSQGIERATCERAQQALTFMNERNVACSIALLHLGAEHTNYPDPNDVQFMDALASLGFDVVAACHSHRTSGYKMIPRAGKQPAFCFYGIGSLSSGVRYSPLEREGLLPVIGLDASGSIAHVEARPIYLSASGWGEAPSGENGELVLDRFLTVSRKILEGSYRERFYRDVSEKLLSTQWRDIRVAFDRAGAGGLIAKMKRLRSAHLRLLFYKGMRTIGLR